MNDSANSKRGGAEAAPYEQLGGAERVRALVERFYDLIEQEPAYAVIRRLHGPDLSGARCTE